VRSLISVEKGRQTLQHRMDDIMYEKLLQAVAPPDRILWKNWFSRSQPRRRDLTCSKAAARWW